MHNTHGSVLRHRVVAGLLLLVASAAALARSPAYDRGDAAYDRGDFPTAVREFRQATQDEPNDALAHWRLGYALRKTGDFAGTVRAWDQARRIDPNFRFTQGGLPKFQSEYNQAVRQAGGRAAATGGGNAPTRMPKGMNPAAHPAILALQKSDAYVDASMGDLVDEMKLEGLARSFQPNVVKIAVLEAVPGNRDRFAEFMHGYLGLHRGTLILVTRGGAAAFTNSLDRRRIIEIVKGSRAQFTSSYYNGIQHLAQQLTGTVQGNQQRSRTGFLAFLLLGLGGAAAFFSARRRKEKRRITELNRDISGRMAALQDEFKRFDLEAAGAQDTPLLQEAKQLRMAAVDPFAAAGEVFNTAAKLDQYEEADRLTTQAEKLAARARVRLDQALGKRTLDDSADGIGAIPRAEDVSEDDRGACFFCSKPSRMESLTPLPIQIKGRTQRVLACEDCAEVARTGRQPQILTVPDDDGRRVPWYQSNRYDPWNDYSRFNGGGGMFGGGFGFGGGGFGLMDYMLLESLFDNDRRSNTTVIMPQDSGYAPHYQRDANGAGFGDDSWLRPESGEGDFFGSGYDGPSGGGESGAGDFFSTDSS